MHATLLTVCGGVFTLSRMSLTSYSFWTIKHGYSILTSISGENSVPYSCSISPTLRNTFIFVKIKMCQLGGTTQPSGPCNIYAKASNDFILHTTLKRLLLLELYITVFHLLEGKDAVTLCLDCSPEQVWPVSVPASPHSLGCLKAAS